jgi:hypothetical protein
MEAVEGMPLEQLEREITELAAHINAATCRWLLLVGELDRREGWAEWGCKSCAHWLSLRCGVGLTAAGTGSGSASAVGVAADGGQLRPRRAELLAGAGNHAGRQAGDRG